jgi:hypothetical protein
MRGERVRELLETLGRRAFDKGNLHIALRRWLLRASGLRASDVD